MLTRRHLAVAVLLVAAAAAPDPGTASAVGTPEATRRAPNVLLVITDDQRADAMADMPQTRRWLAEGGTTFPQAYVTTPLCCPSRSSILSGRYAHNHGVRTNNDGAALDQSTTLPARLRRSGYQTAISGKFLLSWDLDRPPPNFDRYAITNGTSYRGDEFAVDGVRRSVASYSTTFIGEQALTYLDHFEGDEGRPWFLYVAPQAAHSPYLAEDRYAAAPVREWMPGEAVFEADRSDKPPFVQASDVSRQKAGEIRAAQLRTLRSVDDLMASLQARLVALREERDTLVIFSSDNGYQWGEHRLRSKALPYTESIRVPFLMRWPEKVAAGIRDGRLTSTADVAPTVLAAAGVGAASGSPPLDGRSLLAASARRRVLVEYTRDPSFPFPTWASLRSPDFQYVEYYADDGATVTFREFYDLRADAAQMNNLLGDDDPGNDPAVDALAQTLARARTCSGQTCP